MEDPCNLKVAIYKMKEDSSNLETTTFFVLIGIVFVCVIFFNNSDDIKILKDSVGEYDTFYVECIDHLSGKSLVSDSLVDEIQDPDMFDQGEFLGDTSQESPEEVCNYLNKQSKSETTEIIDSLGDTQDDAPDKEWSRFSS